MLGRKERYLRKIANNDDTALMIEQLAADVRQLTYVVQDLTAQLEIERSEKNDE